MPQALIDRCAEQFIVRMESERNTERLLRPVIETRGLLLFGNRAPRPIVGSSAKE